MLDSRYLWAPAGESYGGFCDRHAVMRREHVPLYFGRFNMILDGRINLVDWKLPASIGHGMSSERLLLDLLRFYNISTARFPPVSHLLCCNGQCRAGKCYKAKLPTARGQIRHVMGKYSTEVRSAIVHHMALDLPGSRLRLPTPRRSLPAIAPTTTTETDDGMLFIAAPRSMHVALDCNLSQLHGHYRMKVLPYAYIRWLGANGAPSNYWNFPCPPVVLYELLGGDARYLLRANGTNVTSKPLPRPDQSRFSAWVTWKQKVERGDLSADDPWGGIRPSQMAYEPDGDLVGLSSDP